MPMRQVDAHDLDPDSTKNRLKLGNTGIIRPVGAADGEGSFVKPEGISAVKCPGLLDSGQDRNSQVGIGLSCVIRLCKPGGLTHPGQDRTSHRS